MELEDKPITSGPRFHINLMELDEPHIDLDNDIDDLPNVTAPSFFQLTGPKGKKKVLFTFQQKSSNLFKFLKDV